MTLADLVLGDIGVIEEVTAQGVLLQRLLDLGLVPQTQVKAQFASKGGDPVAYLVRGAVLALRLSTAEQVLISSLRR